MLIGNIEQFKHLSQFTTLKDFNNHIEMWLAEYKSHFTKSELIALKRLIRFSAKVYGVSTASINTILKATEKDGVGVSESTFHRMKRKAVKIGILSIHYTTRKNGSQSSNVWVFNRFVNTIDTPITEQNKQETQANQGADANLNEMEIDSPNKTNIQSKTSILINKRYTGNEAEFTSNRVPKEFVKLVSCFYGKADTIEELWKVVKCATHTLNYTIAEVTEMACDCFRQLIRLVKKGRIKKST
ncbi:hypothetical protein N1I87_01645 [Bacillus sp. FSL W8-0102]|uniref:hypothetical protein n=1 Tax=Bacillus sp. FSL W8-0102 TaxID=2978205 RepID=UPI0030F6CEE7